MSPGPAGFGTVNNPATTPPPAIGFAKGSVWQSNQISYNYGFTPSGDSTNPLDVSSSSGALAAVTQDSTDMETAGITWMLWWPDSYLPSQITKTVDVFNVFQAAGISCLFRYVFDFPAFGTPTIESNSITNLEGIVSSLSAAGIHTYEIGNEYNLCGSNWPYPNIASAPDPATYVATASDITIAVDQYCTRLQNSYNTIKSIDPDAIVIAGGVSYGTYTGYGAITSAAWLTEFCKVTNSAWTFCDAIGLHPYSPGHQSNPPASSLSAIASSRASIAAATGGSHFSGIPLCFTELGEWSSGYTSGQQNGQTNTETTRESDYTSLMTSLKSNGINGGTMPMFYYTWYDGNIPGYGIVNLTGFPSARTYNDVYTAVEAFVA
jgi:hypothetical protein